MLRSCLVVFVSAIVCACAENGDSDALLENATAGDLRMQALRIGTPGVEVEEVFMGVETTLQLSAVATVANGAEETITNATDWSSQNPDIANITKKGLLISTASTGPVTVALQYAGFTASRTINVSDAELIAVAVDDSVAAVDECLAQLFTASGTYSDSTRPNETVSWSLQEADSSIARFDETESGLLRTFGSGTVNVIATGADSAGTVIVSEPFAVTINDALTRIELQSAEGTDLEVPESSELSALAYFGESESGVDITDSASFSSRDDAVATVSANVLTAVAAGLMTVEAECGGVAASLDVTVEEADVNLVSIEVRNGSNAESASVVPGGEGVDLDIAAIFDVGNEDSNYDGAARWEINAASLVGEVADHMTINEDTGLVSVDSGFSSVADVSVTIDAALIDAQGEVMQNASGVDLTDSFTLFVDVEDGLDPLASTTP